MSKLNLVAVAIAAALAAPAALATTVTPADRDQLVASNIFVDADSTYEVQDFRIVASASDNYLGRTVGYNVRVRLSDGELTAAAEEGVLNLSVAPVGGALAATLVSGTVVPGATEFVVNVVPSEDGTQVGEGFVVSGMEITDAVALGSGGTITASGEVYDPTTAVKLPGSDFSGVVLRTVEGLAVTTATSTSTIDVFAPIAKKAFVGGSDTARIGGITIAEADDVDAWIGTADVTADITVTGSNLAAFMESDTDGANEDAGVYLVAGADCSAAPVAQGVIAGNTVSFADVADAARAFSICATANGVDAISAQSFMVQADVEVEGYNGFESSNLALGSFRYNGPVVEVDHFNPASNPQQQSYLRVINDSATAGRVTVEGYCQDGTASDGVASFELASGASRQVNSQDLENGTNGIAGGLGSCGGGKWRLVVTGEFGSMKVQNFLRNSTSAGIINTNINNDDVINGANFPPVID